MNLEQQDPTEKHYGDVGILVKYKYNDIIIIISSACTFYRLRLSSDVELFM
jgi:hypothetical protein